VTPAFLSVIGDVTPGLDVQRALDARGSASVTAQLARARRSAEQLHVTSTPSFFLRRPGRSPVRLQPSALTTDAVSSAIEGAL
jgi:protein-disulfide isomerase